MDPDCIGPADIAIVVDGSSSITFLDEDNWRKLKNFTSKLANTFPMEYGTHVALVQFADKAKIEFDFNRYFTNSEIANHIRFMTQMEGETNIGLALNTLWLDVFGGNGNRPDIKDIVIFITDGKHNADGWEVAPQAAILKSLGVEVFAVGVSSFPDKDSFDVKELVLIASSLDNVFTTRNFDGLADIIDNLQGPICDSGGYKPSTTPIRTLPTTTPMPIGT